MSYELHFIIDAALQGLLFLFVSCVCWYRNRLLLLYYRKPHYCDRHTFLFFTIYYMIVSICPSKYASILCRPTAVIILFKQLHTTSKILYNWVNLLLDWILKILYQNLYKHFTIILNQRSVFLSHAVSKLKCQLWRHAHLHLCEVP